MKATFSLSHLLTFALAWLAADVLSIVGSPSGTSAGRVYAARTRPNILFILVDDLGPEWLGCYGSEHKTPHIDRLAASGMVFERVYATPLCTPTRHELLTGRYPFRTGWTVHHDAPRWGGQYFDWNREITFARVLREAGYATAIAGKWQINDLRTHPDALRQHGFDEHCVWTGYETGNPPSAERYFDPYIQTNGQRGTRHGEFGPQIFADFTIDFMTRHKDRPFLAYHAMVLTHTPFTHTPFNRGQDLRGTALHPGMVDYVDHVIGRFTETLDRLGIRDRTLIIITSDNGTVSGVRGRRNGQTVNGGKGKLLETGICVPLVIHWPAIPEAARGLRRELIDFSDFFPTLIELAGARPPEGITIDGRSFAGLLTGQPGYQPREWIYSQLGPGRVVCDGRYKLYQSGACYDLQEDPFEERPLGADAGGEAARRRQRLEAVLASIPPDAKLPFPPRVTTQPAGQK